MHEPEHRTPVRLTRKPYDPRPQVVKPRPPVDVRPPELVGQPLEPHRRAECKAARDPRESLLRSARRCVMLHLSSSLQQEEHTMLAPILVTAYAAFVFGCAIIIARAFMRTGRR